MVWVCSGDEKIVEAFKFPWLFSRNRERSMLCGPRQGDRCNAVSCRGGFTPPGVWLVLPAAHREGMVLEPSV